MELAAEAENQNFNPQKSYIATYSYVQYNIY